MQYDDDEDGDDHKDHVDNEGDEDNDGGIQAYDEDNDPIETERRGKSKQKLQGTTRLCGFCSCAVVFDILYNFFIYIFFIE